MLYLVRDEHGLGLFRGTNPPQWDGDISQSREDDTCEYVGEVGEVDIAGIAVQPGQVVIVELRKREDLP